MNANKRKFVKTKGKRGGERDLNSESEPAAYKDTKRVSETDSTY